MEKRFILRALLTDGLGHFFLHSSGEWVGRREDATAFTAGDARDWTGRLLGNRTVADIHLLAA
jgi:hypothetical protein